MNYSDNSDGVMVVGLVGSLRPGSYTRLSVRLALDGAAELGAAHALAGLRTASRSLRAWVLPTEVSIPQVAQQFDANGALRDAALAERVRDLGRQVARFAVLHSSQQASEFRRAWESAPVNPGGEWTS